MSNEDIPLNSKDAKKSINNESFSMSKSAINDLPSTAVQSIHIENDEPVCVSDDVFAWKGEGSQTNLPKTVRGKQLSESITKLKNMVATSKQQLVPKEEKKVEKIEKVKEEMKTQKTIETMNIKKSSTTLLKVKRLKAPAKQPSKGRMQTAIKTKMIKKK